MRLLKDQDWNEDVALYPTYESDEKEGIDSLFFKKYFESLFLSTEYYFLSYEEEYKMGDIVVNKESQRLNKDISHWPETNKKKFERLKKEVKQETRHLSTPTDIAMYSAYQRIIGMGEKALPYILEDLKQETFHWFWALQAITGENPIDEDCYGQMEKMANSWIEWGRERNLIR